MTKRRESDVIAFARHAIVSINTGRARHPPRVIARTARNHTVVRAATAKKHARFWRVREGSRAGIAVAISRRVTVVNGIDGEAIPPPNVNAVASMAMVVEVLCEGSQDLSGI